MNKQYRSPLMGSIHETAEGLDAAGVMDKRTMREFDELCLTPVRPLKPKEIRALRLREGAMPSFFSAYPPRYCSMSAGAKRSKPAATAVWVVKRLPARVTASAASKDWPVSSMKLRARSRTANAACPSFR